jgi:hypothetical protein
MPAISRIHLSSSLELIFKLNRIPIILQDVILRHQFYKDSSILLHVIHSPFYWLILKNTIP